MINILFLGYVFEGHVNPTLGLVRELVKLGNHVTYYSSADFKEKIKGTGADFRCYDLTDIEVPLTDDSIRFKSNNIEGVMRSISWTLDFNQKIYNRIYNEVIELSPDLIIHDAQMYTGVKLIRELEKPGVSSITSNVMNHQLFMHDPELYLRNIFHTDSNNIPVVVRILDKFQKRIQTIYQDPYFKIFDFANNPEKLNLVYTIPSLQPYPELLDDTYKFVGHSIIENQLNSGNNDVNIKTSFDNDYPLVYISFGTVRNKNIDIYQQCIQMLGQQHMNIIMSVGKKVSNIDLGEIPDNIQIYPRVSQIDILRKAQVFISHGGLNSVNEAIYCGVPLLILPQGDEDWIVGKIVEKIGAGICVNDLCTNTDIAGLVNTLLTNKRYTKICSDLGKEQKRLGGYKKAAEEVIYYFNSYTKTNT